MRIMFFYSWEGVVTLSLLLFYFADHCHTRSVPPYFFPNVQVNPSASDLSSWPRNFNSPQYLFPRLAPGIPIPVLLLVLNFLERKQWSFPTQRFFALPFSRLERLVTRRSLYRNSSRLLSFTQIEGLSLSSRFISTIYRGFLKALSRDMPPPPSVFFTSLNAFTPLAPGR